MNVLPVLFSHPTAGLRSIRGALCDLPLRTGLPLLQQAEGSFDPLCLSRTVQEFPPVNEGNMPVLGLLCVCTPVTKDLRQRIRSELGLFFLQRDRSHIAYPVQRS